MDTNISPSSTALANAAPAPQTMALPSWFDPNGGVDYWCSLPCNTEENEAIIYHARQGVAETLGEHLGETIDLANILVHQVTVTTDTGEQLSLVRTVLITADGATFATCSEGIRNSVKLLFGTRGLPPYNPPVRVRARQISTKGGHRTYILERVFNKPAGETPTGSKSTKK